MESCTSPIQNIHDLFDVVDGTISGWMTMYPLTPDERQQLHQMLAEHHDHLADTVNDNGTYSDTSQGGSGVPPLNNPSDQSNPTEQPVLWRIDCKTVTGKDTVFVRTNQNDAIQVAKYFNGRATPLYEHPAPPTDDGSNDLPDTDSPESVIAQAGVSGPADAHTGYPSDQSNPSDDTVAVIDITTPTFTLSVSVSPCLSVQVCDCPCGCKSEAHIG